VPVKASAVKADNSTLDAHFALGLAEVLNLWVKRQRGFEVKLKKRIN
jgi:hypothetical protein